MPKFTEIIYLFITTLYVPSERKMLKPKVEYSILALIIGRPKGLKLHPGLKQ